MKKYLIGIAFLLGALITLSVLLYPIVANYVNSQNQSRAVAGYLADVAVIDESEKLAMLENANEYNHWLLYKSNRFFFTPEETEHYNQQLDTGHGVMGVLEIDRINVKLPIFHGTDENVLQVGIGHMQNTSLPMGGIGSHVYITGHRGLPSSKLLTNLDKLAEGDLFALYILGDVLSYQVDEIKTVLPEEADAITIDPEMDYCTLVTCTPYGVNTHRLLVRGHRVEIAIAETFAADAHRLDMQLALLLLLLPALLVLLILAAVKCIKISKGGKAKW